MNTPPAPPRPTARQKLLTAARKVIRTKGYGATTVDELCADAGVTKGAFFHHFRSKEELALAAAAHWTETTDALFAAGPHQAEADPLDRILAYLDYRAALVTGDVADFTCLLGTLMGEVHTTAPAIRDAASAAVAHHAATLEPDFAAAIARHGAPPGVTAASLALHTQAVIQGGFVLAKGAGDPAPAREAIAHARRYVALLFGRADALTRTPPEETAR